MQQAGRKAVTPTGVERLFGEDEIIVSKTDKKGIITYGNDVFLRIAGYELKEILGKPHNIIRHPDMPRCVFKLLWSRLSAGEEIFAYVNNLAKNGDNYWVFAHVTPTFDTDGQIVGYHSSRRAPQRGAIDVITYLYASLLDEESKHNTPKAGMEAGVNMLVKILEDKGISYDEFIFSI